jgi:hypothetical protein
MTLSRSTPSTIHYSRRVVAVKFDGNAYRRQPIVKHYIAHYVVNYCRVRIGGRNEGPFTAKVVCVFERCSLTLCSPFVLAERAIRGEQMPTRLFTLQSNIGTATGTQYLAPCTHPLSAAAAIMCTSPTTLESLYQMPTRGSHLAASKSRF